MNENYAPQNPYQEQSKEDSKKERLKRLQQNRFHSPMEPPAQINKGMQEMRISDTGDISPSRATVPQDMMKKRGPVSSYSESFQSHEYSRVDTSSKMDRESMSKPKMELNEESIKRGVVQQYKTSSVEVPPCPTIPFVAYDEGQASPKFIRPTMYRVPNNYSLHQSTKIPMGLIVQPMADIGEGESELPRAE